MNTQPPAIGQAWPQQGGIYAGLMRGENGKPDYHLVLCTDEQKDEAAWGARGTEAEGADFEFDGLENTTALLRADNNHPAAEWAAGVIAEGHNDFYLPSRREMSLLYTNVPDQLEPGWHWSSTQYSAHYAWDQDCGSGLQDIRSKDGELAVRAVRRVYPFNNLVI